jgi:hypothetical protein
MYKPRLQEETFKTMMIELILKFSLKYQLKNGKRGTAIYILISQYYHILIMIIVLLIACI